METTPRLDPSQHPLPMRHAYSEPDQAKQPERRQEAGTKAKAGLPLYLRVLAGVVLGAVIGLAFGTKPIVYGVGVEDLGQLGLVVIRLLKALAVPLVLFAILDAFARTRISARRGGKLLLICLMNVSVAFVIGLTLMNTLRPGRIWHGRMEQLTGRIQKATPPTANGNLAPGQQTQASLSPMKNFAGYVPESLIDPFLRNNVVTVVLVALLGGAALRRVKERQEASGQSSLQTVERFIEGVYQILVQVLTWVVQTVPFAVLAVVAQGVARSGLEVFGTLWVFVGVILLGLVIHSLVYYPVIAWLGGGRSPRVLFARGADAILTGLSTNSSLAAVPVTLRCLTENMGVSQESARLSACVGTNLNHDGITLYEAMAALFIAQACGLNLSLGQQVAVMLAALMAGVGVVGIPEAGLVVLPLVLGAAGLPDWLIASTIPLVLPVDWLVARARSAVNVMSAMVVAILLDGRIKDPENLFQAKPFPFANVERQHNEK